MDRGRVGQQREIHVNFAGIQNRHIEKAIIFELFSHNVVYVSIIIYLFNNPRNWKDTIFGTEIIMFWFNLHNYVLLIVNIWNFQLVTWKCHQKFWKSLFRRFFFLYIFLVLEIASTMTLLTKNKCYFMLISEIT